MKFDDDISTTITNTWESATLIGNTIKDIFQDLSKPNGNMLSSILEREQH